MVTPALPLAGGDEFAPAIAATNREHLDMLADHRAGNGEADLVVEGDLKAHQGFVVVVAIHRDVGDEIVKILGAVPNWTHRPSLPAGQPEWANPSPCGERAAAARSRSALDDGAEHRDGNDALLQ